MGRDKVRDIPAKDASFPLGADAAHRTLVTSLFGMQALPAPQEAPAGLVYAQDGWDRACDAVCAIGAFDGLHKGHRALVASARADADRRRVPLLAATFSPDPSEVLCPDHEEPRLLRIEDRVRGLLALGADAVLVLPFTEELAASAPAAFVERIRTSVRPVSFHVGTNFRFGAHGAGTVETLSRLGHESGFVCRPQELLEDGGAPVSATRIRRLLAEGSALDEASRLLERWHFIRGEVVHGRGEGTGMGFATANVEAGPLAAMPKEGVYGGYTVVDGRAWPSAINVGAPKMFEKEAWPTFLETHLLGYAGNLYGREVEVVFSRWLRPTVVFDTVDELVATVRRDIGWVHENLSDPGEEAVL